MSRQGDTHASLDVRLWRRIDVRSDDDCWEWTGARTFFGHGVITVKNELRRTHRVAFELVNGLIPDGMCVCHTCDNPPCCNPKHLFLGTQKDNVHDMLSKNRGRWRFGGKRKRLITNGDGDPCHGTAYGYCKLRCRCANCRAAWATNRRAYRARKKEQK